MKSYNLGFLNRLIALLVLCSISLFASIGKITAVNGQVSIERGGKTIEAKAGVELNQKDTVKSKASSNAQLVFADQTVITVGPNSSFGIDEYINDDKNPSAKFKAGDGAFKAITGKIGKLAPDKFKVETKTATIGIRGTRLIIISAAGVETYACTKGTITAIPKTAPMAPPVSGAPVAPAQQQQQQQEPVIIIIKSGQMTTSKGGQIEPPRMYSPTELKQLEKSTEANLKTVLQSLGNEDGGKTPVVVLDSVGAEKVLNTILSNVADVKNDAVVDVNVNKLQDLYGKLTEEEKKVVQAIISSLPTTVTAALSTTPQPTPFLALPPSGVYRYIDVNYANIGGPSVEGIALGAQSYGNFATGRVAHINRIFNPAGGGYDYSFGFGSVSENNVTRYAVGSTQSFVQRQGSSYKPSGTLDFAGASGEFLKHGISEFAANDASMTTPLQVRTEYSGRAGMSSSGFGSYTMSGFSVGAKFDKASGVFPVITGSGAATAVAQINTSPTGLLSGSVTDTDLNAAMTVNTAESVYINNSIMGGTLSSTFAGSPALYYMSWMASLPVMRGGSLVYTDDDAMTWGYWKADTNYASGTGYSGFGYWVVGQALSGLPASPANYQGSVLGSVITSSNQVQDILQNGSNIMTMSVDFGASNAIAGNIQFQTSAATGNSWNVSYSGYTMSSGVITAGTPAFSGTAGPSSLSNGFIKGQCYGVNCVGVGGSFGLQNSNPDKAFGVFRLKKQ